MRKISAYEIVTRLEHNFILKAGLIILGFGMLILSLTFIVWATFFRSQAKLITGINLYTQPIIVKVGQQKAELQPFDSYSFTTTEFAHLKVEVTDLSGLLMTTRSHPVSRAAAIAIDIFSANDSAKYCFASASVQSIYFADSLATSQPTDIQILNTEGSNSFYYAVSSVSNTTLAPGLYDGKSLPSVVDRQQRVWGIYPIDCTDIGDNDAVSNTILMWSTVTPEQQRSLFAQKSLEIVNSSEYNH